MKPSLLLISLDTLRMDVAYSGKFPTLRWFDESALRFDRVVSSVPLTPPSHATIMTGLHPFHHGVRHLFREKLSGDVDTLASILQHAGYTTGAVVSCPGLDRWYCLDRGFDHYDDEIPLLPDGRDPLSVAEVKLRGCALKRAPLVAERSLQWLESQPKDHPFFLLVHFFDTHWPYEAPTLHVAEAANPYEEEVAFMDHHLCEFLEGLDGVGIDIEETIIVCLSDHGEDLAGWYANDHSGVHGHPEEEGHGALLFDVTQLVPLWIRFPPSMEPGRRIPCQVRLVDVMPTVLELMGIELPGPLDGQSLLPLVSGVTAPLHLPAYSETFYREELAAANPEYAGLSPWKAMRIDDRHKVIWELNGPRIRYYDLVSDPDEKNPLLLG